MQHGEQNEERYARLNTTTDTSGAPRVFHCQGNLTIFFLQFHSTRLTKCCLLTHSDIVGKVYRVAKNGKVGHFNSAAS